MITILHKTFLNAFAQPDNYWILIKMSLKFVLAEGPSNNKSSLV